MCKCWATILSPHAVIKGAPLAPVAFMARLAVGETLRLRVIEVAPVEGHGKFRTVLRDEEGLESVLILDVELPLGMAEIRVMHLGEREGFRPPRG